MSEFNSFSPVFGDMFGGLSLATPEQKKSFMKMKQMSEKQLLMKAKRDTSGDYAMEIILRTKAKLDGKDE